jgi:hypothetical protein
MLFEKKTSLMIGKKRINGNNKSSVFTTMINHVYSGIYANEDSHYEDKKIAYPDINSNFSFSFYPKRRKCFLSKKTKQYLHSLQNR